MPETGWRLRGRVPAAALVMTAVVVFAGAAHAESKYSLLLLGERIWAGEVRAISLGSDMQLLEDSLALQYNPAAWSMIRKVTFTSSGYFSSDRLRSDEYNEREASVRFSTFMIAFPLTRRFTLGVGYRGKYDATANFVTPMTTADGDRYGEFFNRIGGLSNYPFTAAVHVARALQVGGYFSIERGSIEDRWDIIFADPTKNVATSSQKRTMSGTGYGLAAVLRPLRNVSLGAVYEGEIEYDTNVLEQHSNSSSNRAYNETTRLPARWTMSAAWRVQPGYSVYGTYSFSDFTQFEGLDFPGEQLAREDAVSVGFEYGKGLPVWSLRLPIRLSATYTRYPYEYPVDESITSLLFGLGLGLKLRGGMSKVDVAFQGGYMGDLDKNGIDDRMFRVYVGFNGSEIWRRKRGADY